MTTRWWAPAGPAIGPDEHDLMLLTPLGDPEQDLGSALLAHHRIGAAACLMAAQSPLVDERALVEYLALARQTAAPPLVETVSKCVGEGSYAGLLVRDVADAAERGALDLFRAAVAKGVAPPIAAHRCALVYGVPADEMGAYRALATVPQSTPVALADAADRALFATVQKCAAEELAHQPWEPVSKAPVLDDPGTPYYDGRDERGQFATAVDTVVDTEPEEPGYEGPPVGTKPKPRRTPAGYRRSGATRQNAGYQRGYQRTTPPAQPSQAAPTRSPAQKASAQRAAPVRAEMARLRPALERMTAAQEREIDSYAGARPGIDWSDGSYTKPIENPPDRGPFLDIDHELGMVMSVAEYRELLGHLGRTQDGKHRFRMGYVAEQTPVEYLGAYDANTPSAHSALVHGVGEKEWADVETGASQQVEAPVVAVVRYEEIEGKEGQDEATVVQVRKHDAVIEYLGNQGITEQTLGREEFHHLVQEAVERMKPAPLPDNSGTAYVWTQPKSRDVSVVEFVIDGGARGRDDGHGKHSDLRLDPNQMWVVENTRPERIYDPEAGVWRLRYFLRPDWDEFGKAKVFHEEDVVRDERGRFAEEGRAVTRKPRPRGYARGYARTGRPGYARLSTAQPLAKPIERKALRRAAPTKAVLERSKAIQRGLDTLELTRPRTEGFGYTELRRDGRYGVMDSGEFSTLLEMMDRENRFSNSLSRVAVSQRPMGGHNADVVMKTMTADSILTEQYGTQYEVLRETGAPLVLTDVDDNEDRATRRIFEHAVRLFERYPDRQQIVVDYMHDGEVVFRANRTPVDPVVLIEHADELDYSRTMHLEYQGTKSYDRFVLDWDDPLESRHDIETFWDDEDGLHRALLPSVITRPKVEHYRLVNSD